MLDSTGSFLQVPKAETNPPRSLIEPNTWSVSSVEVSKWKVPF